MDMEQLIGAKISAIVAGFVGGVVSLAMIRDLTPKIAVTTVIGGTACAAYLTPLIVEYLDLGGSNVENALAFLTGVCGMNGVAGVFKISERFRANPSIEALKKGPKDGE
jgi:uncharacterized membrane protein